MLLQEEIIQYTDNIAELQLHAQIIILKEAYQEF